MCAYNRKHRQTNNVYMEFQQEHMCVAMMLYVPNIYIVERMHFLLLIPVVDLMGIGKECVQDKREPNTVQRSRNNVMQTN